MHVFATCLSMIDSVVRTFSSTIYPIPSESVEIAVKMYYNHYVSSCYCLEQLPQLVLQLNNISQTHTPRLYVRPAPWYGHITPRKDSQCRAQRARRPLAILFHVDLQRVNGPWCACYCCIEPNCAFRPCHQV